jgi:hypothetical protein
MSASKNYWLLITTNNADGRDDGLTLPANSGAYNIMLKTYNSGVAKDIARWYYKTKDIAVDSITMEPMHITTNILSVYNYTIKTTAALKAGATVTIEFPTFDINRNIGKFLRMYDDDLGTGLLSG